MTTKSTKAEVEQRVDAIYLLLLRREPYANIVRYGSGEWGVGSRQIDSYIARARDRMAEEARIDRERARAEHLAIRRDLFNKAYKDKKWGAAFQIAQDEAKLQGLYFDLTDHLRMAIAAGYRVYEPGSPEDVAAHQATDDAAFEVEIGLAEPSEPNP